MHSVFFDSAVPRRDYKKFPDIILLFLAETILNLGYYFTVPRRDYKILGDYLLFLHYSTESINNVVGNSTVNSYFI